MTNEELLQQTVAELMQADHLALNGEPDRGAVYRQSGVRAIYESDVPIMEEDVFQVYIYQREYSQEIVLNIKAALAAAGFNTAMGQQVMEAGYYRDELRATKRKEDNL